MIYEIKIIEPKALKLLEVLAEMKLISISKASDDAFLNVIKRLRKKAAKNTPSFEEITKEVEFVRSKKYIERTKN